jgi:hypothetical protein
MADYEEQVRISTSSLHIPQMLYDVPFQDALQNQLTFYHLLAL